MGSVSTDHLHIDLQQQVETVFELATSKGHQCMAEGLAMAEDPAMAQSPVGHEYFQ